MPIKRLKTGKGIRVYLHGWDEEGEIVRSYINTRGERDYEIRLGPAHFIFLRRKDFELVDPIVKFKTLVELRKIGRG